jgi:probable rRNA maturation factor
VEVVVETAPGVDSPFDSAWVERVVRAAVTVGAQTTVGDTVEMVVLLADDAVLHDLNRRFRSVDKPTDVLSFEGDAEGSSPACAISHLGDVRARPRAPRRQAEEYGHSFEREAAYLLTHGTLHLLGYDHGDDGEQRRMRGAEERALESLGLTRESAA